MASIKYYAEAGRAKYWAAKLNNPSLILVQSFASDNEFHRK